MISIILAWLLAAPPPEDAAALQRAYPRDLTLEQASEHLAAARAAGLLFDVRPELLLGIAQHESRFQPRTVTREPGHRVSCGVMTPTPQRRCSREELTVVGGYLAGAKHYRMYLDRWAGDERSALIAYAGGSVSVRACRAGLGQRQVCAVAGEFRSRAKKIKETR